MAIELFRGVLEQLRELEDRIAALDRKIVRLCRESEVGRRLAASPGVDPIVATALVAGIGDARQFGCGRDLAAWIGLVPRQHSSGGRPKLLSIGAGGKRYLRKPLLQGARSGLPRLGAKDDGRSRWRRSGLERRGSTRAVVALANKTARIAWVLLARGEAYRAA